MPRFMPTTVTVPNTGAEFAAVRMLSLGVSARDVAARMGLSFTSLLRAEHSLQPVPSERAVAWKQALLEAGRARRVDISRAGLADALVNSSHFAETLAMLSRECDAASRQRQHAVPASAAG